MILYANSLADLPSIAREFLKLAGSHRVFAFHAPMGAGKTTFIAELCRALSVTDDSASPTFSILNEYRVADSDESVYHFDFYRIESPEEAFDIGAEDYFNSGRYCFVEWPEVAEVFLPDDTVDVFIEVDPESNARIFSFEV